MTNYFVYSFVPTFDENGGHAKFMQTYHSQTPISLMKKNTVQYVLNGGYVNLLKSAFLTPRI